MSGIIIFLSLVFAVNISAQRTQPTPKRDIPEIISRDTDLATPPKIDDNVDETTEETASDTINLPQTNKPDTNTDEDTAAKRQKQMMLYLDLLTKTEERATTLRKQLYDLTEKQNSLTSQIKQIEFSLQPDNISNFTSLTGSLRPENLRQQRKQTLEFEKANLESLLDQVNGNLSNLQENVRKAELLVEKIRVRFEKIIDDALSIDEELF